MVPVSILEAPVDEDQLDLDAACGDAKTLSEFSKQFLSACVEDFRDRFQRHLRELSLALADVASR
jgi:hypothetical protein